MPTLFNKMTYIPKISIMITDNKNLFFSMIALFILDLKISIIIMITKNQNPCCKHNHYFIGFHDFNNREM